MWVSGLRLCAKTRRASLISILGLLALLLGWWHSLPSPFLSVPYSWVLHDRHGQLLEARIAADEQWRFPPVSSLPASYVEALIEFEDQRFHEHIGFDWMAIARAFYLNLSSGRVVSGGSTITMQLIRIAKKNPRRTYTEKLLEIVQATRLEAKLSKQEILYLYASHAPFGGNVVGIRAASWRYFGRQPDALTWGESALLAVLPNSPSYIRPGVNQQKLILKRNGLLKRLLAKNKLTQLDYDLAIAEPLPQSMLAFPKMAPHLIDSLSTNKALFRLKTLSGTSPEVDTDNLGSHSSTLDWQVQRGLKLIVESQASELALSNIHHLAAIVVDTQSGQVLGYVGNARYDFEPHSGFALDLVHRPRSTGSILKPLLYASMLEKGEITPNQLVADVPVKFSGYAPENYDLKFRGVVPAKQALAQSLNIPAVNMLKDHGIHTFYDFLKDAGMTSLFRPADDYGLPLILGGAEGSLWDMTQLYVQLGQLAQSLPVTPMSILSTADTYPLKGATLSAGSAWLTLEALVEVNRPGELGFWKQYSSARKVAWKTGTSFGFRDAWAIGVTPKYTVGVWVGNAEGTGTVGLTGTQAAAPVMFDIFNQLPKTDWFQKPEYSLKSVEVCEQDGYLASRYCAPVKIDLPLYSNYSTVTPYHRRIHVDKAGDYRVSSRCESIANMKSVNWFSLPPHLGHYFQKTNSDYSPMPKWREDCLNLMSARSPISIVYPKKGYKVYLPTVLSGKKSSMVAEVAHTYSASELFWYLDSEYLGSTKDIHKMELAPSYGAHDLLVLDESGNQSSTRFHVLNKR